ncbi:MAG: rhomboid family intramembrane serine protease [Planctomycetota bacterium]|nr:rhomboid family intramembrane serine protease [Planctomycetota bacterium]
MLPLRDNIPSRTTPVVNYLMIAICSLVFFEQVNREPGEPSLVEQYGMIPARVSDSGATVKIVESRHVETPFGIQTTELERPLAPSAVPPWTTLLTCVFLHGGWMHFFGNMWFLWIFGDNVEDRYGHLGYLIFYLFCGVAASATHFAASPTSIVPTIGASGAIAGVMGAYMLLYPRARVLTLVPLVVFLHVISVPAPLFLGIWFLLQFYQGAVASASAGAAGVAWWAHIGGFVAGLVLTWLLGSKRKLRPPVERIRPGSDRMVYSRVSPWSRARRLN